MRLRDRIYAAYAVLRGRPVMVNVRFSVKQDLLLHHQPDIILVNNYHER